MTEVGMYLCKSCSKSVSKWSGKCPGCNEWGTLEESDPSSYSKNSKILKLHNISIEKTSRISTGIGEIDKVLGGGIVAGSAILIGGEPGIGKSTLLMQIASKFSQDCLYISGEESASQISMRARRLGLSNSGFLLLESNSLQDIKNTIQNHKKTNLMIIDSIQTTFSKENSSAIPGSITQVRVCTSELMEIAKKNNIILIIVGHITKDGQIAGPKTLEHMVDVVLYFEGQKDYQFRILRAVKNRFGMSNESAILQMSEKGLQEVDNPSSFFLSESDYSYSGISIFAGMEGSRAILIEIQALISKTHMPTPRRAVVGWDVNRLAMIIAVLNTRYGVFLNDKEIYLNIAGGIKVQDTAADLAVVCALLSASANKPIKNNCIIFGEVALSGEVRKVNFTGTRIKEAKRLGFHESIIPYSKHDEKIPNSQTIRHVKDLQKII